MVQFDVIDEKVISAPVETVFRELVAMGGGHGDWFLPHLRVELLSGDPTVVGARTKVNVHRGPSFTARLAELVPNRLYHLAYDGGAFRGDGWWTVAPVEGGTLVRLRWQAAPHGIWRWIARVVNIPREHSRVIQAGLAGLARYLGPQTTRPASAPRATWSGLPRDCAS